MRKNIMTEEKLTPKQRKRKVLEVAVEHARICGIHQVMRQSVADDAGVGAGTVSLYFNTMGQLRRAIARHAMLNMDPEILSQLLVDPAFKKKLSQAHKNTALKFLAG
jgi:DNA-binding transcriptional regulator YbjK